MQIEYLKTILIVAKVNSFHGASQILHCSPSAVSKQVMKIEQELNLRLFYRSSNSNTVELTETGRVCLPIIKKIVEEYKNLCAINPSFSGTLHKVLLKVCLDGNIWSSSGITNLISMFYNVYPEIQMLCENKDCSYGLELLKKEKIDAVIAHRPVWKTEPNESLYLDEIGNLTIIPIGGIELSIAMRPGHPKCQREFVHFRDLRHETFIFGENLDEMKYPLNEMFIRACSLNNFTPNVQNIHVIPTSGNIADIKYDIVSKSNKIALSFAPAKVRKRHDICYVTVLDSPYYVEFAIIAKNKSKNIRILEDFFTHYVL